MESKDEVINETDRRVRLMAEAEMRFYKGVKFDNSNIIDSHIIGSYVVSTGNLRWCRSGEDIIKTNGVDPNTGTWTIYKNGEWANNFKKPEL